MKKIITSVFPLLGPFEKPPDHQNFKEIRPKSPQGDRPIVLAPSPDGVKFNG
jgi:hypothetical protein